MESDKENQAEFLTTIEKWGLLELLARCGSGPKVLVVIEVRPRHARTGLLEERGRWIHKVWDAALDKIPGVAGHRLLWPQLLFICHGTDVQAAEATFAEILRLYKDEALESLCVLSTASGGTDAMLAEVDRMLDGLGKEWNFGNPTLFERWLLDGERLMPPPPRNS